MKEASVFWGLLALLVPGSVVTAAPPAGIPVLSVPEKVESGWKLEWDSEKGISYTLLGCDDGKSWEEVETLEGTGGKIEFTQTDLGEAKQYFWRLRTSTGLFSNIERLFSILRLERVDGEGEVISAGVPEGWMITWSSEFGVSYRLERATALAGWQSVLTKLGSDGETSAIDFEATGPRNFWRVVRLGAGGEPLVVSDVMVGYELEGSTSSALFQVMASGTEAIESVVFFDDGVPLGNAQPGFGDAWTFSVVWDSGSPEIRSLEAEVTTEEGTVARTPVRRFLLADPSRFVPLDGDGAPGYGEFIPVDGSGELGAFQFYPEGFGDPGETTGAHFEFGPGSTFESFVVSGSPDEGESQPSPPPIDRLLFTAATFYRGHVDPTPISVNAAGSIDLQGLTPEEVAIAFGIPLGEVQLCWGDTCVTWEGGSLSEGGWGALQIDLEIGDFGLPGGRLNATVGIDPDTGEPFLIVCYFGSWSPVEGTTFEIPEADPLKIYLTQGGQFSAHGTAEATFANGAEVRGTLSWNRPCFEFRFEGKGIVIPALGSLRQLVAIDPESAIPSGDTTGELDEFAEFLEGQLVASRGIAAASSSLAEPGSTPPPPLPKPSDPAGAALEAWAGRIASWQTDRAGQILTLTQSDELVELVAQSEKLAVGASDLPTVLKLLRDLRKLRVNGEGLFPAGEVDHLARIAAAEQRVEVAAARVAREMSVFAPPEIFARISTLMEEITDIVDESAVSGSPLAVKSPDIQARRGLPGRESPPPNALLVIIDRKRDELFPRHGIVAGDSTGAITFGPGGNPTLGALPLSGQLSYLGELIDFFVLLTIQFGIDSADESSINYPIDEALGQLLEVMLSKHNQAMADAIASGNYLAMRDQIGIRTRIVNNYEFAGLPVSGTRFNPANLQTIIAFEDVVADWLSRIDPSVRREQYADNLRLLIELQTVFDDEILDAIIRRRWLELASFNRRFVNDRLSLECDAFFEELANRGFTLPADAKTFETDHTIRITGKYESTAPNPPFRTLQINQAGQYFLGWLQVHKQGRFRLRGSLLSASSTELQFAFLKIVEVGDQDGLISGSGTLSATPNPDGTVALTITETGGSPVGYVQNSNYPAFSPSSFEFFEGDLSELVAAHQLAPLHSRELIALDALIARAKQEIFSYNFVEIDSSRAAFARNLNGTIREIIETVDPASLPLARFHFLQTLSKLPFVTLNDVDRTSRELFLIALQTEPGRSILTMTDPDPQPGVDPEGKADDLMGSTATSRIAGNGANDGQQFQYRLKVATVGVTAEVGIGIGAFDLDVEIRKYNPGNSPNANEQLDNPDEIWEFDGWLAQGGLGPGIKAGITGSIDTDLIKSAIEYQQDDLQGPVVSLAAAASAVGGTGVTISEASLIFRGTGQLPPLIFNTGDVNDPNFTIGIALGAGLEASVGMLVSENTANNANALRVNTAILNFEPTVPAEFETSFEFKFASAELSDCGRQYLREFVAEHRSILASPGSRVAILGFTDTSATDGTNQTLSQNRANTVRNAIFEILGDTTDAQGNPLPRLPDDRVVAIGLGEAPAKFGFGTDGNRPAWFNGVAPEYQQTVLDFGQIGDQIADETLDPMWRQVIIAVNGLVSVKMKTTINNG
ncbi:MAG: OmpA family protein [Verrucomicrobiota bacterium]